MKLVIKKIVVEGQGQYTVFFQTTNTAFPGRDPIDIEFKSLPGQTPAEIKQQATDLATLLWSLF